MGRITGGEVTYGRTVKTGEYENKRVDVKLSFGVDESESHETALGLSAASAVAKAHEMLGMAPVVSASPKPVTRRTASVPGPTETPAPAANSNRSGVPPTPGSVLGAEDPITGIPEGLKAANRANPAEPVDPLGDVLGDAAPPAEVTDKALVEAVTRHNGKIKNPIAIRELLTKYMGGVTGTLITLPKDKRAAFIAELEQIPAATK